MSLVRGSNSISQLLMFRVFVDVSHIRCKRWTNKCWLTVDLVPNIELITERVDCFGSSITGDQLKSTVHLTCTRGGAPISNWGIENNLVEKVVWKNQKLKLNSKSSFQFNHLLALFNSRHQLVRNLKLNCRFENVNLYGERRVRNAMECHD